MTSVFDLGPLVDGGGRAPFDAKLGHSPASRSWCSSCFFFFADTSTTVHLLRTSGDLLVERALGEMGGSHAVQSGSHADRST